jgi:hypothetical protein
MAIGKSIYTEFYLTFYDRKIFLQLLQQIYFNKLKKYLANFLQLSIKPLPSQSEKK